jgi:outer membrane protein assembly factor BamB
VGKRNLIDSAIVVGIQKFNILNNSVDSLIRVDSLKSNFLNAVDIRVSKNSSNQIISAMIFQPSYLINGASVSFFYLFNHSSNTIVFSEKLMNNLEHRIVGVDGSYLYLNTGGNIECYNLNTSSKLWSTNIHGEGGSNLSYGYFPFTSFLTEAGKFYAIFDSEKIYFQSKFGDIIALNKLSGAVVWRTPIIYAPVARINYYKGNIVAFCDKNRIIILNASTGIIRKNINAAISVDPQIVFSSWRDVVVDNTNDQIIFTDFYGMTALDLSTLKL